MKRVKRRKFGLVGFLTIDGATSLDNECRVLSPSPYTQNEENSQDSSTGRVLSTSPRGRGGGAGRE